MPCNMERRTSKLGLSEGSFFQHFIIMLYLFKMGDFVNQTAYSLFSLFPINSASAIVVKCSWEVLLFQRAFHYNNLGKLWLANKVLENREFDLSLSHSAPSSTEHKNVRTVLD